MIIGLIGFKGCGKNTVGEYLNRKYGYKQESFASSIKDIISPLFGWDRVKLEGITEDDRIFRETEDIFWSKRLGTKCTPRWVMQTFGTDIIRQHFNEKIWIYSLERRIRDYNNNIVITDVRFPDEIDFLKNKGAILIYIERDEPPSWFYNIEKVPKDLHISEWAWVKYKPELCINNKGSREDLYFEIDKIMLSLTIDLIV